MYEQIIYKKETIDKISKETGLSIERSMELYFILEDRWENIVNLKNGEFLKSIFEESRNIFKDNHQSEIMIQIVEFRFSQCKITKSGTIKPKSYKEIAVLCERTPERVRQILNLYGRDMRKCIESFYVAIHPRYANIRTLKYRGLDTGTINSLMRKGVNTLEDITKYSEEELLLFRGLGKVGIEKIKEILNTCNLKLKE